MHPRRWLIVLASLGLWMLRPVQAGVSDQRQANLVLFVHVDNEPITPVSAGFIERALREATEERAVCLIIQLDTPGGLVESTREITNNILASPVPVVLYVAPTGARAASAGVFITMASHVAAMAPATHIGAAHPVSIGGMPGTPPPQDEGSGEQEQRPSVMEEKILNDTVAWIRSLAELRGRNADWAVSSVTESKSITAAEALELGVIEILADNRNDLLAALDGREVTLESGPVTLRTAGASVREVEMWWGERLLGVLSNPNIAFLLLMLGFYGILFEFYTPGWGVAGTMGAISLVLAFFGLAVLPINYAGLLLIFLGLGMFVAEAFFTSFGALTLGGAICLILGGAMLVDTPVQLMRVSMAVLVPVALATALIAFFLITRVVHTHRKRILTGDEMLSGEQAIAQETFTARPDGYRGFVLFRGELWLAISPRPVSQHELVRLEKREGLTLHIEPMGKLSRVTDSRS